MRIPVSELAPETLYNIAESFVLREGTDYGEQEVELEVKVNEVMAQLRHGDAILIYSELHESIDIVDKVTYQTRLDQERE
ncbi:YheU family protein [Aestuariibacter sp. AA17]|uniref:YheU family protein n=1 Tax=Fluctibacter corallii TaxID=2984329 RepID=A0ABT3AB49_9ALTE|nr:YheU family protein [Aestuariibacter sp. AA17]MCV2885815.1 YheU family protein [Aestuariibacter sp. AA17]